MTPSEYRNLREAIGSLDSVARLLGVHRRTIARREHGKVPITEEAAYALTHVVLCRRPKE